VLAGRLLAFAALLFVMAAIAAAIAPAPVERNEQRPAPVAPGHTPAQTVRAQLPGPGGRVVTLHPRAGDVVELRVTSREIDDVVIEGLDIREPVDETSPAILNFIADRQGSYDVRLDRQEKLVGTLDVRSRRGSSAR
jgi:hypothetical protein